MKIATIIARSLLGLIFVVFGLNMFLHFIPMPPPPEGSHRRAGSRKKAGPGRAQRVRGPWLVTPQKIAGLFPLYPVRFCDVLSFIQAASTAAGTRSPRAAGIRRFHSSPVQSLDRGATGRTLGGGV